MMEQGRSRCRRKGRSICPAVDRCSLRIGGRCLCRAGYSGNPYRRKSAMEPKAPRTSSHGVELVIVQSPTTAASPVMPQAAITATRTDRILPLTEIGPYLTALTVPAAEQINGRQLKSGPPPGGRLRRNDYRKSGRPGRDTH